jgi:hypothetical protein
MPPKIQIKRTKTNLYPEKFTKEKHITIDIKRKNKPDISIHRGVGKNKVTGEKSVTRMTTKIDRGSGKMAQNMVVNRKDASGNKTKIYKTGGLQYKGGTYYKGQDKATYQESKKINRAAVNKEAAVKKDVMKKLSKNTAPVMKRAMREGSEEVKQNVMNGVRKNLANKYPSYKSKP